MRQEPYPVFRRDIFAADGELRGYQQTRRTHETFHATTSFISDAGNVHRISLADSRAVDDPGGLRAWQAETASRFRFLRESDDFMGRSHGPSASTSAAALA